MNAEINLTKSEVLMMDSLHGNNTLYQTITITMHFRCVVESYGRVFRHAQTPRVAFAAVLTTHLTGLGNGQNVRFDLVIVNVGNVLCSKPTAT